VTESNEKKANLVGLPSCQDDTPIADIEPRRRLGTLIRRYRVNASRSLRDMAKHLDLSPTMLGEVERGLAVLQAGQLQEVAAYLKVRYDPLLDAARDWHRAIWEAKGKAGVQLADMKTQTTSARPHDVAAESELELALITAADELVFMSNVAREVSIRAERAALEARDLLERRGVLIPEEQPVDGPQMVECAGPSHSPKLPVRLQRGKDFVLAFVPEDGGGTVHFCSKKCGDEWRARKAQETGEANPG
jgi:transcriptional regulator with XRE-family HTH domain